LPLRVGGIDYLNAQPLLYSLLDAGEPPLSVRPHPPSELARLLREGALDVALLPVVACAERADYHVVPGIAIASYGAVQSIRLYHRCPLEAARVVALDACSRTSALLTQVLFREVWRGAPAFTSAPPVGLEAALKGPVEAAGFDAALVIGDAALRSGHHGGWEEADLGTEWTRWTGLPFVYAFWVCRVEGEPGSLERSLVERLHAARDRGVAHVDDIVNDLVERGKLPAGMAASDCRRYLSQMIHYDLGPDKLEALDFFLERLRAAGLMEAPEKLRFLPDPSARVTLV
jgi:chorismate dehydratase